MKYANCLWVLLSLVLSSCKDDAPADPEEEPEKIECPEPGFKAATICCYDPTDEENVDCSMHCQPTCTADEDCSEGDSCQYGVCGPDDDCSL
jgi:hypothetical protein